MNTHYQAQYLVLIQIFQQILRFLFSINVRLKQVKVLHHDFLSKNELFYLHFRETFFHIVNNNTNQQLNQCLLLFHL